MTRWIHRILPDAKKSWCHFLVETGIPQIRLRFHFMKPVSLTFKSGRTQQQGEEAWSPDIF